MRRRCSPEVATGGYLLPPTAWCFTGAEDHELGRRRAGSSQK